MVAASGARAAPTRVIAIVQAAGRRIGIDGDHVVQAIAVPSDMTAMPRRAGGIVGVVSHGEQVVPVVRLEQWLAASAGEDATGGEAEAPTLPIDGASGGRIVILGQGERVVGLLVEAVVGMRHCAASAIARLFHDERPDELFASAVRLDAQMPPLALIEPARLVALAGVWAEAAGLATRASTALAVAEVRSDASTTRVSVGVFRIGDVLVGIAADDIGELLLKPALRPAPLRHATTRGLCDWRDRLLPVVDIAGLLGASPDAEAPAWMCVVRHRGVVLGLLVHEIIELQVADLPLAGDASRVLVRHELPSARGILQVLDTAALMSWCPESGISLRGNASTRQDAHATSPHAWLVFDAGGSYATRIEHVQEIVPLPPTLRPRLEAELSASLQWRGHAVPVRALFASAGLAASVRDACLLLVILVGDARIAVPIASVKAIIAPRTSTVSRLRVRAHVVEVVSTLAVEGRASYEVVDLTSRVAMAQGAHPAA